MANAPPSVEVATFMVDAFRDGVPEAVKDLQQAGIPGGIITGRSISCLCSMSLYDIVLPYQYSYL